MIVNLENLKDKFYHLTLYKNNLSQTQIESFTD